jgi:hypothetical protein
LSIVGGAAECATVEGRYFDPEGVDDSNGADFEDALMGAGWAGVRIKVELAKDRTGGTFASEFNLSSG